MAASHARTFVSSKSTPHHLPYTKPDTLTSTHQNRSLCRRLDPPWPTETSRRCCDSKTWFFIRSRNQISVPRSDGFGKRSRCVLLPAIVAADTGLWSDMSTRHRIDLIPHHQHAEPKEAFGTRDMHEVQAYRNSQSTSSSAIHILSIGLPFLFVSTTQSIRCHSFTSRSFFLSSGASLLSTSSLCLLALLRSFQYLLLSKCTRDNSLV